MSKFTIQLQEKGRCHIQHELAGAEIITDLPPEYGGTGRSFSATDLVSVAVGACILTSIESILSRAGHDPGKVKISVTKTLSDTPKMIQSICLELFYPEQLGKILIEKLEKAIAGCPVKRSLHEQVEVKTVFLNG